MGNYLSSSAPPPPLSFPTEHNNENVASNSLKAFSFKDIKTATKGLNSNNTILIDGPYISYEGWINEQTLSPETHENSMPVAVKKLELDGFTGHHNHWLAKLNHVAQLHHPNLVRVIGFCLEDEICEHRFLVSEFLPRGNLENLLYGYEGTPPLSWNKRMKVAIGAAKGLCFLHDARPQVIYRYLDPSSILIDADYNAKLSAYLSTQVRDIQGIATEGYSSQGYAAPEFINIGRVSAKSDVYSFGVLLLALLTRRHGMVHSNTTTLVDWACQFRQNLVEIMDTTRMKKNYPKKAAITIAKLALDCTYDFEDGRPDMSDVLRRLEDAVTPQKCI